MASEYMNLKPVQPSVHNQKEAYKHVNCMLGHARALEDLDFTDEYMLVRFISEKILAGKAFEMLFILMRETGMLDPIHIEQSEQRLDAIRKAQRETVNKEAYFTD